MQSLSSGPPPSPPARTAPPFLFSALLLVVIATSNINNFFAYHAPGAIAQSLQSTYHLSTSSFGLLFTLYSLPNIVLVFIGGVLIDRYGPAYTSLIFNFCMLAGMVIFALAPADRPMLCFVIGRLLLGFGESLCASVATMLGLWFKGSVLTFSVGFNQAYVQLFGSAAAFYLLPLLPTAVDALWVTAAVCLLSFLANVVYVLLEKGFPQYRPDYQLIADSDDEQQDDTTGQVANGYHTAGSEQAAVDNGWRLQGHSHNVDDDDATDDEVVHMHSDSISPSPSGIFASVTSLPLLYWLIIVMILLLSPILYTFTAFGPLEFQAKWHLTAAESGAATSVLYVTIIFSPLAGYVIDTFGYRTLIQAVAAAFIPVWFLLLTYSSTSPVVGMTLLGLTFAVTESNGYAMIVSTSLNGNLCGDRCSSCTDCLCAVVSLLSLSPGRSRTAAPAGHRIRYSGLCCVVGTAAGAGRCGVDLHADW